MALEISFCWEGEAALVRRLSRRQSESRAREARHCPPTDRFWDRPRPSPKAEKISQAGAESFEAIAREWHAKFSPGWVASHGDRILRRLEKDVFPWLGKRPIGEIKAPELLLVLRRIESRGALETTHRTMQNCGQVFRYAVATGRAERDPTGIFMAQSHHRKKSIMLRSLIRNISRNC